MINSIILAFILLSTIIMSQCPTGQTSCGGTCVTLLSDVNNCGACGSVCDNNGTCNFGRCVCPVVQCPYGHHAGQNCSCCIDPCFGPGSTFWTNMGHAGGCPTGITTDTTPEDCCLRCYHDPNCAQWGFNSLRHPGLCQLNVIFTPEQLAANNVATATQCVGPLIDGTPYGEASGGRCVDELTPCFGVNDHGFPLNPNGTTCSVLIPYPVPVAAPVPTPSPSPPSASSGANTYNFNCNCDCDNYCDTKYGKNNNSTSSEPPSNNSSEYSRRFV